MAKYFDKFPTVTYNGTIARNIIARTAFTEAARKDIYSNFDYTLPSEGVRADYLSSVTYNSPYYDWVIYMMNDVVDPYHDVYLRSTEFEDYIIGKYGSVDNARNTILFYRNNWYDDETSLTVDSYDSLDYDIQRYYNPIINNANQVVSYRRKQEDWIQSTNKIVELTIYGDVNEYPIGSRITQSFTLAQGTVCNIDAVNNILTIQHVSGTFEIEMLYTDVINGIKTISQIIPDTEAAYWNPVSAYEYEAELNETKKHINLIKPSYVSDIEKTFQALIKAQ